MKLVVFMTRGMSLEKWATGGVLGRELALYDKLAELGVSTTFISWGGKCDSSVVVDRPHVSVCANSFGLKKKTYERLLPYLHAKTFWAADIVKTNQMNGADIALGCAMKWRTPFIARCGYMWSEFRERQERVEELPIIRRIEKAAYLSASLGIVTTQSMAEYLEREYNCPSEKLRVVPNYVPSMFFEKNGQSPSAVTSGRPVVLSIGRLAEQKNLKALVKACAGLDVVLRIVGEGPERGELQSLASELGVELELPGKLPHEQLPMEFANATVYAQVSLYEGHPKTLLESMACGAAIIASDAPGVSGVVTHGETALTCTTTFDAIHSALRVMLENQELRESLRQRAYEVALEKYSVDSIAAYEWSLYQEVLKGKA